jgi:uncharacterized protein
MSSPQHEPTMEEILASIRKIISEDTPEASQAPAAAPSAGQELLETPPETELAESGSDEMEVLELTHEIIDTPEPEPAAMSEPPKPVEMPEEVVFEEAEEPAAPAAEGGIFSDQTRRAMDDAFAAISEESEEPEAPAPRAPAAPLPSVAGSSVETVFERAVRESFEPVLEKYLADNSGAVIERMKPLIREWMDEHFPALLEGAVRGEIERVVRARGRR